MSENKKIIPLLSKSSFVSGMQCQKRLYLECYYRELADKVSESQQATFDNGTRVGQLARQLYHGGLLVEADHFHFEQALSITKPALTNKAIPAIFEAAFRWDDLRVRTDILVRVENDELDLIEVKSSTQVKEEHIPDAAIQYYVLTGRGLKVRSIFIGYLNPNYIYAGGEYDLTKLFMIENVTAHVHQVQNQIPEKIHNFREILSKSQIPNILVGKQCKNPHDCAFLSYCQKGLPEHYIMELPRISEALLTSLQAEGINDIRNIPGSFPGLNTVQKLVRECIVNNVCHIDGKISEELHSLEYPINFLDFETFNPPLPIYIGTHPWQVIPFQWSNHILEKDGNLRHEEYLHDGVDDPRKLLAEKLLKTLGTRGSIIVYSGFEKTRIKELADAFPQLGDDLLGLLPRIFDLLPLVRKYCYHPDFHGKFSIKSVLPALVPNLGYKDLEINEGGLASLAYFEIIDSKTSAEKRKELRTNLLKYCERDTEAMVRLVERLK